MDAPKVSVETLLPEDAKKPLDRTQVELVARGLLRPNAGMVKRLAIDWMKLSKIRPVAKDDREERGEARAYAAEAYWKEKQGEEYGSY
jgi:hypothetical protein